MEIDIFGTPGNDLAAFLFGHRLVVHGNAQDGVGNTMDDGEIVIEGRAGDVLGFSMRGGTIYVRDGCGDRTALHMKEYEGKWLRHRRDGSGFSGSLRHPWLEEQPSFSYLKGQGHRANFIDQVCMAWNDSTAGAQEVILLLRWSQQVEISPIDEADRGILDQYVSGFIEKFPDLELIPEEVLKMISSSSSRDQRGPIAIYIHTENLTK